MGGSQYMVFEWFETLDECLSSCANRKSKVKMFPIYLPSLDSSK